MRAAGVLAGAWLLAVVLFACSNKSSRMGEAETLQYKRDLIEANKEELSPEYADRLMYYPGRTRGEIDSYLGDLKEEYAEEQAVERAQWEAAREFGRGLERELNSRGFNPAGLDPKGPNSTGPDSTVGGGTDGSTE